MKRVEVGEIIIGSIFLSANKLNLIGDRFLPDITFKQFILLIMIEKMDIDEKNINNIAEFVGSTRQNVKKMLSVLQQKGYVKISKSLQDARALKVELSDKAYQYFSENAQHSAEETEHLFTSFTSEELHVFMTCLQKLLIEFENSEIRE